MQDEENVDMVFINFIESFHSISIVHCGFNGEI